MPTDPTTLEAREVEDRAREMLQDLIGSRYSDTTLRVATDWLKQEQRFAALTFANPETVGRGTPREPTEAMLAAGAVAIQDARDCSMADLAAAAWRAMYAEAPALSRPLPRVEREAVARIIDPIAHSDADRYLDGTRDKVIASAKCRGALAKADAILALIGEGK